MDTNTPRPAVPVPASLDGRVAVIIGAGGIGSASARQLAGAGARVALGYRGDRDRAETLLASLPGTGHRAYPVDIEQTPTIQRMAAAVQADHGRADLLLNAAGMTEPVPHADLERLDDALIDRIFASNWRGVFAAIRAFAPLLRQGGAGLVVNISSIAATTGVGSNVAYCAAKAGVDVMTRSLARALGPEIRMVAVSPGVVDTGFVPGRDRAWMERQAAGTPLRAVVGPEHVAAAVLAAATHLPLTTGTVLTVDGGRHL